MWPLQQQKQEASQVVFLLRSAVLCCVMLCVMKVVVEGKAFFAVAAAPTPFVVSTGMGEVTVHGTRFELIAGEEELSTGVF